ncbi:MAG: hypothetical protein AAGA60_28475 [Cyanobacteria bacterium P01_E01_bin.42]
MNLKSFLALAVTAPLLATAIANFRPQTPTNAREISFEAPSLPVANAGDRTQSASPVLTPYGEKILGTIVGWGEAEENEFVLETQTGRTLVYAGPRWMQNFELSKGDIITVWGEWDDREFDAFFITYADGKVVEVRAHHDNAWD